MDERAQREEDLLIRSLEVPEDKRGDFIQSECSGDRHLAERVTRLLRAHEKAHEFLEALPGNASQRVADQLRRVAPSEERPGDQIGRYRLVELLGEGASGSVWVARQTEDIDRLVALKILKLGMDSKEFLARFKAERQVHAMMEHPNIARVLDAGATEYGRPYLVMELVKGTPLVEFADKKQLSLEERIKLFIDVCHAIHHAHRKGVIHRDLKPSNILVSLQNGEMVPKVIDFGVAKANPGRLADNIVSTNVNTFIGTPLYCSPEQLDFTGGDIDARSDLYSLGALLYQLLCGTTPFDCDANSNEAMASFYHRVREEDPLRPSLRFANLSEEDRERVATRRNSVPGKLESNLKGELDWIVIKCLKKEPNRRYHSAQALAEDLQAYLVGDPISAGAPSSIYRIRKIITRKRPAYAIWFEASTVMCAILAAVYYFRPDPISENVLTDKSIAVLPLENLSEDPDNAFFADGVQEDILINLSKFEDLDKVMTRSSTAKYRNPDRNLKEIGRALNVRYLLEGSVRRDRSQVRIAVQLIDSQSDSQLWTESYTRPMTLDDTFEIQTEIAKEVARELKAIVSPEEIAQLEYRPTENQEAYDCYVRARELLENGIPISIDERISLYERAVAHDPDFGEAWAKLADQRIAKWGRENRKDPELYKKAHEALEQAKIKGPDSADTLSALSTFAFRERYDNLAAIDYQLQAIRLNPQLYNGHTLLGHRYRYFGHLVEAQHHFEKALLVDPLAYGNNYFLLETYVGRRMWDEAFALIEKNETSLKNERWGRLHAYTRYLQNGNKHEYVKAIELLPGYNEDSYPQLQGSLFARNYPNALLHFENLDPVWWLNYPNFGGTNLFGGINIEYTRLPAALIQFARDAREEWLTEAENARTTLVERIDHPMSNPINWAQLSICYALKGNSGCMDTMIKEAREKSLHPYYRYRFQSEVEIHIAIAYIVLGNHYKAVEILEAASKMDGPVFLNRELERLFIFDSLRGNPRFEALLRGEGGPLSPGGVSEPASPSVAAALAEAVPEKSIAVLPLENLSPDPDVAFFADGVQTDILGGLTKIKELSVIGRTSTLQYKNTAKTLQQIGEELGVRYLVEGSVRRAEKQVIVDAQLADAQTGRLIWTEKYQRELDDIFAIQAAIAMQIAGNLQAVISPEEIAQIEYRPTEIQEAYDYFTKYNQMVADRPGHTEEKISLLEKAVELDSRFAEAWAQLAIEYMVLWNRDHRRNSTLLKKGHQALETARQLNSGMARIAYADGLFSNLEHNDLEKAKEFLLRALEIDPSFNSARSVLGAFYIFSGDLAEAQHALEELLRSNPTDDWANRNLFRTYMARENWDKVRSLIQKNLKRGTHEDGVWRFRKATLNYIQFGDKQDYASNVGSVAGLDKDEAFRMKIRGALYKQNYNRALELIQSGNGGESLSQFLHFGKQFSLTPLHLLSALIHFELNNEADQLKSAAEARKHLEDIIENNPDTQPSTYSNLVLCYALEGDRKKTESKIQQVRELTRQMYWKYTYEAHCEFHIAMAYIVLGEEATAVEILERASHMESPIFLNRELELWFIFDRLRGNPHFDALMK